MRQIERLPQYVRLYYDEHGSYLAVQYVNTREIISLSEDDVNKMDNEYRDRTEFNVKLVVTKE